MIANDRKYWIALKAIDGVGSVGFKNLVGAFGNPRNVFKASLQSLTAVPGIGHKTAANVKDFDGWHKAEEELELLKKYDARLITYHDSLYPRALLNIYDFPPFLYTKGLLKEDDVNIAVVGSRMASTYGKFSTERLCRELAINGITVVSGLARGIDSAAHKGALTGKGRTIAVLGCGLDTVYPPENQKLYEEIVAKGAVISEYPFGTPPSGSNFPARNRIISGVSLGVVVVEANEKSGSLITAKLALEQGREVFAVPGSIDSAGSRGTHKLIKQGAKLIENVHDILDEILPQVEMRFKDAPREERILRNDIDDEKKSEQKTATHALTDAEESILKSISSKALDIDSIITSTGLKPNEVLNILLTLELRGIIKQLPGKKFMVKE
ncbi:MAG TPA: DNA-processing protein DprA [Syntrophales bacterium]